MVAIPSRPLEFGEVLDLGFGLFRLDYRLYVPLALMGLAPATLATALPFAIGDGEFDINSALFVRLAAFLAVGTMFSLWTWAALATAMDARMGDRPASIGASYAHALARLHRLVGAGLLALALLAAAVFVALLPVALVGTWVAFDGGSVLAGAVGVVVILVAMMGVAGWWATHTYMLVPAIVIEERGPLDGLRRCFGLVRGNRLRTFFVFVVTWFIALLPGLAVSSLAGTAGGMFASNPTGSVGLVRYWTVQLAGLGAQSVTTPLWMACAMVLFADLRARSEGTDLRAAAQALAAE